MTMNFLRNVPIKRKLVIISTLTSGVALLLASIGFTAYEQINFRKSMVEDHLSVARMIGDNSTAALSFSDPDSAVQTLKSLSTHPHVMYAAIYDKDGGLFAQYQRFGTAGDFAPSTVREDGVRFDKDFLELFQQINLGGDMLGTVYLRSDLNEMRARMWRYGLIVMVVILTASLVAFLVSTRLQRVISDPISHLVEIASAVAADRNYSVRAVKQGDDELGHLIDGFNEMLAQIQARDGELRNSHDHLEKRVEERTAELKREVFERKRSEAALRDTNERFEVVTQATTDVIWDWDMGNDTLWWNENFQSVFGYPAEEVGRDLSVWNSRIHPEDQSRIHHSLKVAIDHGRHLWSDEYRFLRHDGTYAFVFDRGYVLHDAKGKPVRMIGAMQDITERKRAEEALRSSREIIKGILNAIPMRVFWKDRNLVYLGCNSAFARDAGFSDQTDVIGKDDFQMSWRGQAELYRGDDREVIETGCSKLFVEEPQTTPEGNTITLLTSKLPLRNSKGEINAVLGTYMDITDRKKAEAELVRTHKELLDVSRRAGMAEVATGVLHNVGNVLNSVNVSATLIGDRLRNGKTAGFAKVATLLKEQAVDLPGFFANDARAAQLPGYLEQFAGYLAGEREAVLGEVDSLRKNIEHIKDIVAMQQSYAKVSGVAEVVNITDLLEDALQMNSGALIRHDVQVVREYGAEPPPETTTEKHKVLQILVNLIRNAKYACDESGRSDKRLTVQVSHSDGRLRISVADNGVGIPAENLTRIFNHGFTTRKDGHGFGLHSGALAAKELGGKLTAESDGPGLGARFTLELPLVTPEIARARAELRGDDEAARPGIGDNADPQPDTSTHAKPPNCRSSGVVHDRTNGEPADPNGAMDIGAEVPDSNCIAR